MIQDLIGVRLALVTLVSGGGRPEGDGAPRVAARRARRGDDAAPRRRRRARGADDRRRRSATRCAPSSRAGRERHGDRLERGDSDGAVDEIGDDERAELLRVFNEAVSTWSATPTRRRSTSRCGVEGDRVRLVVEDDGVGPGRRRSAPPAWGCATYGRAAASAAASACSASPGRRRDPAGVVGARDRPAAERRIRPAGSAELGEPPLVERPAGVVRDLPEEAVGVLEVAAVPAPEDALGAA